MDYKDLVKGMFLKEETNEQLMLVKKKGLNWADLNNPSKSDVNVSPELARKMFDKIKNRINLASCKLADTSCGNAEIQVIGKEEYNIPVENMFIADVSKLNISIAQTRLRTNISYKYSKSKKGILEMTKILEENKVDIEITNDPFSMGKGNSDQLYPILMHTSPQRIKKGGYRVCIDPPTWTSGTKQVTDSGRVNLLEFFTTEHNLLELDYSVNNDFPGIGSQFVSSAIQIGVPYNGETKITTVGEDIFYVNLTAVKALPDSKSLTKEIFELFVKMQQKTGEKFYFKYCNNKHCSTSDYVDEYSKNTPHEYVNASSNHGKKYAQHSNNVAKNFVHSAYMGSNFKFDYFLDSNVSVMSNARVWIHDDLKNTTKEILASIFESELFKKTVYTYKFTQYNECAFLNNIAIPPLDRVWTNKELEQWYLNGN
tara:strand:- start:322 stop:1602 length:1281 start_codon:yes stop_codon:yes gene_type:complete